MSIKRFAPAPVKTGIKMLLRKVTDLRTGNYRKMASMKRNSSETFNHIIRLTQPIQPGTYFENKVHNITHGMNQINGITLWPGEVFSFWQLVKRPSRRNNYKLGRNIISAQVSADYGGGLCQLSSIVYHTALTAGMTILERHNHSVDIYKEHERFTPLGADATVVYGYKDLRFKNPNAFAVKLTFSIEGSTLTCTIAGQQALQERGIFFEKNYHSQSVLVSTLECGEKGNVLLNEAVYHLPA